MPTRALILASSALISLLLPAVALAQSQTPVFQLPTVIVTAQKEPADPRTLPVSVTAVTKDVLDSAGIRIVSEAGMYAPNANFSEFTARKLSNPRFRGIGSSPANPGVTTYFDGVPQLNSNTASVDLLDVSQVEFVRGAQSALFGRNVLGGVINVTSVRPSLDAWTGTFAVPLANFDERDVRGSASGPVIAGKLGAGVSLAYGRRDGFTVNDVTGNDLDSRSAFSAKGQLLWTPTTKWETRLILSGERARDGDYALHDLASLRSNPFHAARDFEGHTQRDVFGTTILSRYEGARFAISNTTGFVSWSTEDATDLDYSPLPLLTRQNAEDAFQFTEEVRLASAAKAPLRLSDALSLRWQTGVFLFTQNYEQDAVNNFSPFVLSPFVAFPVSQHSPQSVLDDVGVGIYGQATATLRERLDLSVGARFDHEHKEGTLNTFFTPTIAAPSSVIAEKDFSNVSPQFSAAFRPDTTYTVYGSISRGFKAGGFNPASPVGREAYDEEHTWQTEGGLKATLMDGRVWAGAAVFNIDWQDLQLNLPNPSVPGQFFIANIGGASSRGVEFEANARVHPAVDVFGALGFTRARFDQGSTSSGVSVGGNTIPNTPDYTAMFGTQVSRAIRNGIQLYGRAELVVSGAFHYDDMNLAEQQAYSLTNLRIGARGSYLFGEAWVRNAFDTHYIPVAFAYGPLAPSGFIGEMGRPRQFGVNFGVSF